MDKTTNEYHFSFFSPHNQIARKNRNMVVWLVAIWAVAIFGFQIALRVLEKPVPEPALAEFNSVWDNVSQGTASQEEYRIFASSVLHTLGKTTLVESHREVLKNAFTYGLFRAAGENNADLIASIEQFRLVSEEGLNITDPQYLQARFAVEQQVLSVLGINPTDPRILSAPFSIVPEAKEIFGPEKQDVTEESMHRYLIHNRSVLTDTIFLGFPFHYFYTAVLLLVLFVGLCVVYCVAMDRLEKDKKLV